MTSRERWSLIRGLFEEALALPESERPALLERCCADDDELRHELEALLAADAVDDDALEPAARSEATSAWLAGTRAPAVGTRFGPWELGQPIGSVAQACVVVPGHRDVNVRVGEAAGTALEA